MSACLLCETADAEGGYLCRGCTKTTVVRLECLPVLYNALAAHLQPGTSGPQGRGATAVHAPMPVAELPLTMRGPGGMVGVVEDWRSLVHQERGMTAPRPVGSVEGRLHAAVKGLLANMPWVAVSWPLAGAFAEEIRDLVAGATSVIDPRDPGERGTRVGYCPAAFEDGVICGAVLRLLPGERVVRCRWCGVTYPPAMWEGLKILIDGDAAARSETRDEIRDQLEEPCPNAS